MSKSKKKSFRNMSIEEKCKAIAQKQAGKAHPESACEPIEMKSREQYLKYLDLIQSDTAIIHIVQIEGENAGDPVVQTAKKTMPLESEKTVSEWFGTSTLEKRAREYVFRKDKAFFDYLRTFEAFFIEISDCPYRFRLTDFGTDDIAFVGKNGNLLFYTTTHEGDAYLNSCLALLNKNLY